jgi:putative tricarboxylic transport membrane protein
VFCCVGVYSVNDSAFDVALAAGLGIFGFIFNRIGCSPMGLVIGFLLGPVLEQSIRRALLISRGDPSVFVTRPISLALLLLAAGLILYTLVSALRTKPILVDQPRTEPHT